MIRATIKDFDLLDANINTVNWRNLKRLDWALMLLVLVLGCIGIVVMFSASKSAYSTVPFYLKQAGFLLVGIVLALTVMCIDSRFLVSVAPLFYVGAVGMLASVILFGHAAKGSTRWLPLGPIHLQPSEETKLVVVYMLTWYLTTVKERIQKLPYLILAFVITGVPAVLILKQPSLGTALSLLPVCVAMVYVAGCKWWHLVGFMLIGFILAPVGFPFVYKRLEDHQRKRIDSFINPEADPIRTGWQTRQSIITVGSGGLSGKGFGNSTQTMLNYLPEHHTDFIFSLLAEEHGFIGATTVIVLFTMLLWRGLKLAIDCNDMANTLLAVGVLTMLAFHIFVNIAITIGLMPVTGIPLPFLSYGGNFYVTTMAGIGVLLHVPVRKQLFD